MTPESDPNDSVRSEMTSLKVDLENFKVEVDKKIDTVHMAMNQGFSDMKLLMDDLLGNRGTRNVRARMDVDEEL